MLTVIAIACNLANYQSMRFILPVSWFDKRCMSCFPYSPDYYKILLIWGGLLHKPTHSRLGAQPGLYFGGGYSRNFIR